MIQQIGRYSVRILGRTVMDGGMLWMLSSLSEAGFRVSYAKHLKVVLRADDTPLDNSPETHTAIPYFVAGQLVMYDDPYRYAALHNEWETRLSRLSEAAAAEEGRVRDRYAGFDCGELW